LIAVRGSHAWRSIAPVFGVSMLVVLALYGGVLKGWWCCDDPQILKHAVTYSPWEYFSKPEAWRALIPYSLTPWLSLTYDLDHTIWGLNPLGYYAHNLVVIALCACLIHQISRQWVDMWHAVGGALLFLVGSPIMVASQQLMVRHYIEGLFFYLVALWLLIRELQQGTGRSGWLAGLAFAIAATAKELYLPLGFVPLLLPMGSFKKRLQVAWPLLLVMLLYVPWRWYMLGDVVGGYTPAGSLGRSDLTAALGQFANIPGLLLVAPWFGLSAVGLTTIFLLLKNKKNGWVLLVVLPVLLLVPLIPLARMPGIGAGSERYFIVLWAVVSIGASVVLGRVAGGFVARLCTLAVLVVLVVSAWINTRQVRTRILPELQEQQVQGRALVTAGSRDVIYLTSAVATWYVSGIMDLRKDFGQTAPPPLLVADELDLDRVSLMDHRVMRYDHVSRTMIDITPSVPQITAEWRKKIRPASLTVAMEFDTGTKTMQWQLGPYGKGSYTLLPEGGRHPVPAQGALRMDKPPDNVFRFRYDAPEGWIAYTPPLHFVPAGSRSYRVVWHGTGIPGERR